MGEGILHFLKSIIPQFLGRKTTVNEIIQIPIFYLYLSYVPHFNLNREKNKYTLCFMCLKAW